MADDLAKMDATAQAELVRSGAVSPRELVDAAIERVEKFNPQLNAVIRPRYEKARAEADSASLPNGPLKGVPFLLKDLSACMEMMRSIAAVRRSSGAIHGPSQHLSGR